MKRVMLLLLLVIFTVNLQAQDKAAVAQKAIDKKDYKNGFKQLPKNYLMQTMQTVRHVF